MHVTFRESLKKINDFNVQIQKCGVPSSQEMRSWLVFPWLSPAEGAEPHKGRESNPKQSNGGFLGALTVCIRGPKMLPKALVKRLGLYPKTQQPKTLLALVTAMVATEMQAWRSGLTG